MELQRVGPPMTSLVTIGIKPTLLAAGSPPALILSCAWFRNETPPNPGITLPTFALIALKFVPFRRSLVTLVPDRVNQSIDPASNATDTKRLC
jgi:hypothetical protein